MFWLTLLVIVKLCQPCLSATGLLWDKYQQKFVPILSIPKYAQVYEESKAKTEESFAKKLDGRAVVLEYSKFEHLFETNDDETKISGPFGEIWNTLAQYSNFTFRPLSITSIDPELDIAFIINSLRICTDGISPDIDCTIPILKMNVQLYIPLVTRPDSFWIFKVYEPTTQLGVIGLWFVFGIAGIVTERVYNRWNTKKINLPLSDRIFYMCTTYMVQGWEPSQLAQASKILVFFHRIFCWFYSFLLSWALLQFLTATIPILPFEGFKSLLEDTEYHVLRRINPQSQRQLMRKYPERITPSYSTEKALETVCSSDRKYAILDADIHNKYADASCTFMPIGGVVDRIFFSGLIPKKFPYSRSIHKGILKMHENGMIKLVMDRVRIPPRINNVLTWESIDFEHVYMIHMILASGALTAIICLICEHIIFRLKQNQKNTLRQFNNRKRRHTRKF